MNLSQVIDLRMSSEKKIVYQDNDIKPKYEQLKKNYASLELYNIILENDLHETIKEVHKEYAERIKLKRTLSNFSSSEYITAMSNVSSSVNLLSNSNVDDNSKIIKIIDSGVFQLSTLFEVISNLALLQTSKYELLESIIYLPDILTKLMVYIDRLKKVVGKQYVFFDFSFEKNSSKGIICDENAIYLLLQNLCLVITEHICKAKIKVIIKSNKYTRHSQITFELNDDFPISKLGFLTNSDNELDASKPSTYSINSTLIQELVSLLDCSFYIKSSNIVQNSFVLIIPY